MDTTVELWLERDCLVPRPSSASLPGDVCTDACVGGEDHVCA